MAGKTFRTIGFVIYRYEKSKPAKEEGTISMTDSRHKMVKENPEGHFGGYDGIGAMVRRFIAAR
jgi:hypothetical protein